MFIVMCKFVLLSEAYIAPLSNACQPYICEPYTTSTVRWGVGRTGRLLHNSDAVDISREGIRFIDGAVDGRYYQLARSACVAGADVLCDIEAAAGSIFPSYDAVFTGSTPQHKLTSLIATDRACSTDDATGGGRTYTAEDTRYDVSTCNVQKGGYSVVYMPGTQEVALHRRTFGPMAYALVLLLCTVNVTGVACVSYCDSPSALSLYLVNAACSACVSIYFLVLPSSPRLWVTNGDQIYLAFTLTCCVTYCLLSVIARAWQMHDPLLRIYVQQGACLHAIDTIGTLIYHTPETPYSSILLLTLAARTMSRVTRCADVAEVTTWWSIADAIVCGTHLVLQANFGVLPQLIDAETWPAIFATILFCGYVWVYCDCNALPLNEKK